MRLALTALLLPLLLYGCSGGGADGSAAKAGPAAAPIEALRHSFFPRPESEDYWETVPAAEVGPRFLLVIHPRIRTPAEGPWNITFLDPSGNAFSRHENLRVDTATGQFTFLCSTADFRPGDWVIHIELVEGGMAAGPDKRVYRFRVA